jgi:hypothetical protein
LKIALFPFVLARVAGAPFESLEKNKLKKLNEQTEKLYNLTNGLIELQLSLSEELFSFFNKLNDYEQKKVVLNVKRAIYNGRNIDQKNLILFLTFATDNLLCKKMVLYEQQKESIKFHLDLFRKCYANSVADLRQQFINHIKQPAFFNGLLFASHSLFDSAKKYIDNSSATLNEKRLQTELGLLKYYTRMVTKTTPFSSFTNIAISPIKQKAEDKIIKGVFPVKSHVRINSYLLRHFLYVLKHVDAFYTKCPVKINSTLTLVEDQFIFLINSNNSEAFQKMQSNDMLKFITDQLTNTNTFTFNSLVNLITLETDASPKIIAEYLNNLLSYGFLEFDLKISGKDPDWIEGLIALIEKMNIKDHVIYNFLASLCKLKKLIETHEKEPDTASRRELQMQITDVATSTYLALCEGSNLYNKEVNIDTINKIKATPILKKTEAKPVKERIFQMHDEMPFNLTNENILYEDTTRNLPVYAEYENLSKIGSALQSLNRYIDINQVDVLTKGSLKTYFINRFSKNATIKFLDFYNNYHIDEKNGVLGEVAHKDPTYILIGKKMQQWSSLISILFEEKLKEQSDGVNVTEQDVRHISEIIKGNYNIESKLTSSYSAFVQIIKNNEGLSNKCVLNALFPGNGKMFSRFLHFFENDITREVIASNSAMDNSVIYVQNNDNSYFNVNIHPQLMEYEINGPGIANVLDTKNTIFIKNLIVKFDEETDRLVLIDQTKNKEILIFDVDYQATYQRSALFKLLNNFTTKQPAVMFYFTKAFRDSYIKVNYTEKGIDPSKEIVTFPTLTFEDIVVLRRRTWQVPKAKLPSLQSTDNDFDKFLKVTEWQKLAGIPTEIFVSIVPIDNSEAEYKNNDRKPQYINLENPLLVTLLIKILTKVKNTLSIQEFLPDDRSLLTINNENYIYELLIQWEA